LRYRKHFQGLPGKPDLVFVAARVIVFCDGDFWHGRDWLTLQAKLKRRHNADYWIAKIRCNRDRDRMNTIRLTEDGWLVLRFWESEIMRDATAVAAQIVESVVNRGRPRTGRQPDEVRRKGSASDS
jgi:DNA mismatch endonuclease (patch repair protein)